MKESNDREAALVLAEQGIVSPCGVLSKPFSPQVLIAEVRRCIPAPMI